MKKCFTSVSDNMSPAFGLGLLADGEALLAEPGLPCCSSLSRLDLAAVADGIPICVPNLDGLVPGLLPSASLGRNKNVKALI